jgi:hypothetical protein
MVLCASAQEREIVFHRDVKVGQKFEFDGSLKEEKYQKIEATGAMLKDSSKMLELLMSGYPPTLLIIGMVLATLTTRSILVVSKFH